MLPVGGRGGVGRPVCVPDTSPNAGLRRGDGDIAPAFVERRSTHRKLEATAEIDTRDSGTRKDSPGQRTLEQKPEWGVCSVAQVLSVLRSLKK